MTIDELLKSLQNPNITPKVELLNNKQTWAKIGSRDSFSELGLEGSALDEFLKEWAEANPYSNI